VHTVLSILEAHLGLYYFLLKKRPEQYFMNSDFIPGQFNQGPLGFVEPFVHTRGNESEGVGLFLRKQEAWSTNG